MQTDADTNAPTLTAESLRREVGGKVIVQEASFAIAKGEVVAITGPSGSGKSSLLRLLNRLDEPTSGRVLLHGRDTTAIPTRELRRRVGLVLQSANLFPGTVASNVAYGPSLRGEDLYATAIAELLETVGLRDYQDRDVATLSGGEAQRVSLARTLANHPDVLLLDEPTSALDEAAKQTVERALQSAIERHGQSCLIVTHDPAQARRLAQRVMVMVAGTLSEEATHA